MLSRSLYALHAPCMLLVAVGCRSFWWAVLDFSFQLHNLVLDIVEK